MYLMYRYNSFLKDEKETSLMRVHNREYRIKKEMFSYEELLDCISYFKEPRIVNSSIKYELNSIIVQLLLKMEVLNCSEIDYPHLKVHRYLLKNYKDFNDIEKKITQCEFKFHCFTSYAEENESELRLRIQDFFGTETTDKSNRKIHIILTDGSGSPESVISGIEKEKGSYYIVIAINGKQECRIFSTDVPEMVDKMLDHFIEIGKKTQQFLSQYIALAGNYCALMIMDLLSANSRMYNTYSISATHEIKNRAFYGFSLDEKGFRTMRTECIKADPAIIPAEAINRFINKSKDLLDVEFFYEFAKEDNENLVKSMVKDGDIIEGVAKKEILLDAAMDSVTDCVRKLFKKHGVNVEILFGYDAIAKIKEAYQQLDVFVDNGFLDKMGVLIYKGA